MLAQMKPYTPSLYRADSFARYRKYPRTVVAPIPGVGYDVGKLAWAEQELNLDGSSAPQHYGNYSVVPLRGLGAGDPGSMFTGMDAIERHYYQRLPASLKSQFSTEDVHQMQRAADALREGAGRETVKEEWGGQTVQDRRSDIAAEESAAEAAAYVPLLEEEGFFSKKLGPVPLWAVIGGGVLAAGGAGWWFMRRKKR
jgi:LPXTG-motif cell wall-anchored protein